MGEFATAPLMTKSIFSVSALNIFCGNLLLD